MAAISRADRADDAALLAGLALMAAMRLGPTLWTVWGMLAVAVTMFTGGYLAPRLMQELAALEPGSAAALALQERLS